MGGPRTDPGENGDTSAKRPDQGGERARLTVSLSVKKYY